MKACKTAIQLLTRFSFPQRSEEELDEGTLLFCLPLVGLGMGVIVCALGYLLPWVTGRVLGAVIGGLAIPAVLCWLRAGRDVRGMIWFLDRLPAPPESATAAVYVKVSAFQALVLVKVGCIAALLYQRQAAWLIPAVVLGTASFADMTSARLAQATAKAPGPWHVWARHWLVAALVTLIVSGVTRHFMAGVFALVIAWLASPALEKWLAHSAEAGERARRAAAELVEIGLLAVGLLYFAGIAGAGGAVGSSGGSPAENPASLGAASGDRPVSASSAVRTEVPPSNR